MAEKISFSKAVKAAKFLMITSIMQTFSKGALDPVQFTLAIDMANDKLIGPEWRCEQGDKIGKISLYEGNTLVYTGDAQNFVASQYCQEYFHDITHVWKADQLINEMKDAMTKLANPPIPSFEALTKGASMPESYKGDFSDTEVYEIWKKHTRSGSFIGRLFGRR